MNKSTLYTITIPLAIASLSVFTWLSQKNNNQQLSEGVVTTGSPEALVERYGALRKSSSSGDMRFDYYDIDQGKTLENLDGKYPWFFATIRDLENDKAVTDFVQYVQHNKDAVFKVTGKKEADDCDYFGNGICLENIAVEKIEVVSR